jgi:hypothetical protein
VILSTTVDRAECGCKHFDVFLNTSQLLMMIEGRALLAFFANCSGWPEIFSHRSKKNPAHENHE